MNKLSLTKMRSSLCYINNHSSNRRHFNIIFRHSLFRNSLSRNSPFHSSLILSRLNHN